MERSGSGGQAPPHGVPRRAASILTPAKDAEEETEQIEALVARIRARGAAPLPKPAPDAVARFLAHTAQQSPMSEEELSEHEQVWRAVDAEVRALDPSNGIEPGLV